MKAITNFAIEFIYTYIAPQLLGYFEEQCTVLFLTGNSNPRLLTLQSSHYTNYTTPGPLL
jgi:hypothetical protein